MATVPQGETWLYLFNRAVRMYLYLHARGLFDGRARMQLVTFKEDGTKDVREVEFNFGVKNSPDDEKKRGDKRPRLFLVPLDDGEAPPKE